MPFPAALSTVPFRQSRFDSPHSTVPFRPSGLSQSVREWVSGCRMASQPLAGGRARNERYHRTAGSEKSRIPEGCQPPSVGKRNPNGNGSRPKAVKGLERTCWHPCRDAPISRIRIRWYRFARPPAKGWDAYSIPLAKTVPDLWCAMKFHPAVLHPSRGASPGRKTVMP